MGEDDFSSESIGFKPFTGACAKLPPDEDTKFWARNYGFALAPSDGEGMEDENKVPTVPKAGKKAKKKRKRSRSSSSSSSSDCVDVKALEDAAKAALESQKKEGKKDDVKDRVEAR